MVTWRNKKNANRAYFTINPIDDLMVSLQPGMPMS